MFARLLALVCLLHVSQFGWGMNLGDVSVAIRLKTSTESSAISIREMQTELERLMRSQGVQVTWWDAKGSTSSGRLVVLELKGTCEAPELIPAGPPITDQTALASSPVENEQILPFSWIHCDALAQFIGHSVAELPKPQRDFLYGRAMARLAAHELYHILSGTKEHEETGIAKAQFTSADLLGTELGFQEVAMATAPEYNTMPATFPTTLEDAFGK